MGEARKPHSYTDEEKRRALDLLEKNSGNLLQTSQQTGVPRPTLKRWWRISQDALDVRFERLAYQLLAIAPEKMNEASLQQIIGALKMVLERLDRIEDSEEEVSDDVYEKLADLIARYVPDGAAVGALTASEEG